MTDSQILTGNVLPPASAGERHRAAWIRPARLLTAWLGVVVGLAVGFVPEPTAGQTVRTWITTTVPSGTFQWVAGANWSSDTVPTASTTAYFAGPTVTGTINIEQRTQTTGTNSVKGFTFDYADTIRIYSTNTGRGIAIGSDGITMTASSGSVAFAPQGLSVTWPL